MIDDPEPLEHHSASPGGAKPAVVPNRLKPPHEKTSGENLMKRHTPPFRADMVGSLLSHPAPEGGAPEAP